jgi:hypothetical protein
MLQENDEEQIICIFAWQRVVAQYTRLSAVGMYSVKW